MKSTRRKFVRGLTLAGTAGLLGVQPGSAGAEAPPETTTIKIGLSPSLCAAPQFVAEELLRREGFADVQYVRPATPALIWPELASGAVHISAAFSGPFIIRIDAQDPIVLLGGIHTGCFELFAGEGVRAIRDLKGKSVAILARGGVGHVFLAAMAAHVGLDPRKDINWVVHPAADAKRLLAEGVTSWSVVCSLRISGDSENEEGIRSRCPGWLTMAAPGWLSMGDSTWLSMGDPGWLSFPDPGGSL